MIVKKNSCTFYGHRECPESIREELNNCLIKLIEEENVTDFYVGNQGAFDRIVYNVLKELKKTYGHISCTVVLAYMPGEREKRSPEDYRETQLPEEVERSPRRYAIDRRNRWMLRQADVVVTYIVHNWGGAAKFAELAKRQKKQVIELHGR